MDFLLTVKSVAPAYLLKSLLTLHATAPDLVRGIPRVSTTCNKSRNRNQKYEQNKKPACAVLYKPANLSVRNHTVNSYNADSNAHTHQPILMSYFNTYNYSRFNSLIQMKGNFSVGGWRSLKAWRVGWTFGPWDAWPNKFILWAQHCENEVSIILLCVMQCCIR